MRLAIIAAGALWLSACAASAPDTVLFNGKIFTGHDAQPWAQALAIKGERIIGVGDTSTILALAGPGTRRLDLAGRTTVPGLNDAHLELSGATAASLRVLGAEALSHGVTSLQVFSTTPVADTVRAFRQAALPLRVRILRMPQPEAAGVTRDSRPFFPPQPTPRIDVRGMGFVLGGAEGERLRQAVGWAYGSEDPLAVAGRDETATAAYLVALAEHGAADVWKAKRPRVEQPVAMPLEWYAHLPPLGAVVVQSPRAGSPLASFVSAGIPLALGSGDTFLGFEAVRLATMAALGRERLTVAQALVAYGYGGAVSEFEEKDKGRLVVGALADLAVLGGDPFAAGEEELGRIRSVLTMIGGRPVYDVPRP